MGRVVDLIDAVTGEIIPSLISLDRPTNELISLRMEFVRIPDVLCGVRLSLEQKQVLRDGKALLIENMLSKKGTLFSATVQFNADMQWVEFMFENKFRSSGFSEVYHSERGIPSAFRGKKLRKWQMDKLEAEETAYISGLESRAVRFIRVILALISREGRLCFLLRIRRTNRGVLKML